MRKLLLAFGLLCASLAPALAAPPTTLRIGLREDPDILDPTLSGSYVGRIVFAGMCDKLFDYDTKLEIVPQLATGYTYKDPTHLVLHLRPGVLFQDGEKFDAAAVKSTLERDLTMPGSLRRGQINAIKSIEVVDPLTVEIVLKQPDSPLLAQLAGRPGIIAGAEGDRLRRPRVRPAPGLRRPVPLRQPRAAAEDRAGEVQALLEREGDPFRPAGL